MRAYSKHFDTWDEQDQIVVARVIRTWGSSPRPVGSMLVFDESFKMYGSVSGGCVEGAVLKAAQKLVKTKGHVLNHYGVTDEEAWTVGLSCGGKLDVLIQVLEKGEFRRELFNKIKTDERFYWTTNLTTGENFIESKARQGEAVFSQKMSRKPLMLIIGAAHISSDLIHLAKFHGFKTVVIDPRATFVNNIHFDNKPDELIEDYPSEVLNEFPLDEDTYAVILSHDPKIDDNALGVLLPSPIKYLGALGSKRTHAKRVSRLEEAGFSTEEIGKIHAPIGLPLGGREPREVALSVMAEIITVKNKS